MKKNFDNLYEKLGGTYREKNGHLIPDIALPEQTDYQIGKYGRMHLDYLHQTAPSRKLHHAFERGQVKRSAARNRS